MMLSSGKKQKSSRMADYYKDGVELLESRLEIQILKRMKEAFYAISSSVDIGSSCVFEGRR